ncbi:MAG: sulfatase [Bacteroidales bacterium]
MSIRKNIKEIVGLITTALISVFYAQAEGQNQSRKPNILCIMVDDLGYGDLSYTGAEDLHTPNIDRLFENGMEFTDFYANCTVSSPTRASLITGRYPDLAGVPGVIRTHETNSWGYLREDLVTLPQMLNKAGYHTAIIGKWHLGLEPPNIPNERGFDYFKGFLGDMMDDYWTHLRHGNNYMRDNRKEINPKGHATDLFSEWSVDYLENAKDKESPFFLYLAYNAPHFPIQPPEEWFEKVKKREPDLSEKRAKNVAFVEHLDAGVGRVMTALREEGLYENTLIIFTSDNGGSLPHGASNGPLRGGKQDMYEGGIKVPTVFTWENTIESGSRCESRGLTMDIFPTLCEVAGVEINYEIDGVSLYPSLMGKDQNTDERVVYFVRREGHRYGGLAYYAAMKGKYKLLQNTPYESMQLFNIVSDPYERWPLDESNNAFGELKDSLTQHIRKTGAIPWQKE